MSIIRYGTSYSYDKRGNITSLQRNGMTDVNGCTTHTQIDNLNYTYPSNSNQLSNVHDNSGNTEGFENGWGGNYNYDSNGNITLHKDRKLSITYNHLNLPTLIQNFGNQGGFLHFKYDAAGNLLQRKASYTSSGNDPVETIDYVAGIEYKNGQVSQIMHNEGYVQYTNGTNPEYHYTIQDHLGNTRLIYSDKNQNGKIESNTEIIQENHYYPFGLTMKGAWMGNENNYKYKYNGIEQVDNFGIDMNFAFYRTLDPTIGRWLQVDPKGESFGSLSPYNSMGNNPISIVDPDGDFITWSAGNGGGSIGVNFTPVGIPLGGGVNLGGGSIGLYGEVGYRSGGLGVSISQSLNYNFNSKSFSTTTTAGVHASFGIVNAGASVGGTYDFGSNTLAGNWGVNAGLGVGNEKGGIGLFVGYGSGGLSYGIGGYYDPRVKFKPLTTTLILNDDGTYSEQNNKGDHSVGPSEENHEYASNLINNPNVEIVNNGNGTYSYTVKISGKYSTITIDGYPKHPLLGKGRTLRNAVFTPGENGGAGKLTFTSYGIVRKMSFSGVRPKTGDYFNFQNFNAKTTSKGRQPIWHLNLFSGRR